MFRITGKIAEIELHSKEKDYKGELKLELLSKKEHVISDEDIEIKKGIPMKIKIKKIEIKPYSLTIVSGYSLNTKGSLLSICEDVPMPYDSTRYGKYAIFMPIEDGKIKSGEVLGAVMFIHGE